jgi:uncharacterized membrane protein (UPF0136 family)
MTATSLGQAALFVYALVLGVGGVMGFVKAGSKMSFVAGLGSGALVLVALGVSLFEATPRNGFLVGLGVAVALTILFLRRYLKTRKAMPAGMLLGASAGMAVLLLAVLARS